MWVWIVVCGVCDSLISMPRSRSPSGRCRQDKTHGRTKARGGIQRDGGAKDRKEEFNDPARKDHILGRNTTRLELWEEHIKDPIVALDKALKCVEDKC